MLLLEKNAGLDDNNEYPTAENPWAEGTDAANKARNKERALGPAIMVTVTHVWKKSVSEIVVVDDDAVFG
jgi:hypothetical protein